MDHYLRHFFKSVRSGGIYLKPENFRVTHRLDSVNDLGDLESEYDLFLLDRDCTLQPYHDTQRVPEFEKTLQRIAHKSEIVSNSSFRTFLGIRDVYGDLMPISKMIRLHGFGDPDLLRLDGGGLRVISYLPYSRTFNDQTSEKALNGALLFDVEHDYDKPDPLVIRAVVDWNIVTKRVPTQPRVLMVGDSYLTDIVAGNLAGVDTARVRPFKPMVDRLDLILLRYALDSPWGAMMSRHEELDL